MVKRSKNRDHSTQTTRGSETPPNQFPAQRRSFLKNSAALGLSTLTANSFLHASAFSRSDVYQQNSVQARQPYPDPLPDYDDDYYPKNIDEDNLPDVNTNPKDAPNNPRIKPDSGQHIDAKWTRLADMPFPVQEIYPAPFWTNQIANRQSRKALRAQRFNIIVNAGGIVGVNNGRVAATRQVSVYDPIADRWTIGPAFPDAGHHIQLVPQNGYLYALGGFSSNNRNAGWEMRDRIYRLASLDDKWEYVGNMPSPQSEAVCVSLNGFIHVVGGRAPGGSRNSQWADHIDTDRHYAYDPRARQWIELAPMSIPRNSAAGVAMRGVLYLMGGRRVSGGNLDITEAYDPLSDRWQKLRPMPQAQAGLAAAAIGDIIYVFGGEYFGTRNRDGGVYKKVWAYDTSEDRWHSVSPMPRPRHGLGAVNLNDAIYVIGGAARPGGVQTSNVLDRFLLT